MQKERNDSSSEETTVENQAGMTSNRLDGLKKRVQGWQSER